MTNKPSSLLLIAAVCMSQQALTEELGFAGPGAQNCSVVSQNAIPGRGSGQNVVTQNVFSWVQGYMSGFNAYSYMVKGGAFDLGAASPEAQWEYLVSFC